MADYIYADLGKYEKVSAVKSYHGEETSTIKTIIDSDKGSVKSDLKISNIDNNNIEIKSDGIFTPKYKLQDTHLNYSVDANEDLILDDSIRDYHFITVKYCNDNNVYQSLCLPVDSIVNGLAYSLFIIEHCNNLTGINCATLTFESDNVISLTNILGITIKHIIGTNLVVA